MDFRRVEPKFQRAAMLLQLVLCLFLLFYVAFSSKQIVDSSVDPPVHTTTRTWKKDLGVWAVCSTELYGVGTSSGASVFSVYEEPSGLAGAKVSPPQMLYIPDYGHELQCAEIDLTEGELIGRFPFHFTLCVEGPHGSHWLLKTNDQYQIVTVVGGTTLKWFSLAKSITGWNYGFSSVEQTSLVRSSMDQPYGSVNRTIKCAADMTLFGSKRNAGSALHLTVENDVVVVYLKQGILPQLFTLFTSIGGYVTFLTIVFTCVFMKKYPESPVSRIHEARTLAFERIWPSLPHQSTNNNQTDVDVTCPAPLQLPPGMFPELQKDTE